MRGIVEIIVRVVGVVMVGVVMVVEVVLVEEGRESGNSEKDESVLLSCVDCCKETDGGDIARNIDVAEGVSGLWNGGGSGVWGSGVWGTGCGDGRIGGGGGSAASDEDSDGGFSQSRI